MKRIMVIVVSLMFLLNTAWINTEAATTPRTMEIVPSTTVYTNPYRIEGTEGMQVTLDIMIDNVTNLIAFQVGALFDPNVVNCSGVTEGGFLSNNGVDPIAEFPAIIDNVEGIAVPYGCTLLLSEEVKVKNGSGRLAYFTFYMKATGYSDIHILAFIAYNFDLYQIPCRLIDFYTAAVDQSRFTVKIVGNAQGQGQFIDGGYSAHNITELDPVPPDIYHGQLSFNVTGLPLDDWGDQFAYFNVTIPNNRMWCDTPEQWLLQMDGVEQATRTVHENATHTTISLEFAYSQEIYQRTIKIKSVHIGKKGDINDDGIINIMDAAQIGFYWLQHVPQAPANVDINGDGTINIKDVGIVALNWLDP